MIFIIFLSIHCSYVGEGGAQWNTGHNETVDLLAVQKGLLQRDSSGNAESQQPDPFH